MHIHVHILSSTHKKLCGKHTSRQTYTETHIQSCTNAYSAHIHIHSHVRGSNNHPDLIHFLPGSAPYCCEYNISNMTSCPYTPTYILGREDCEEGPLLKSTIKSTGFQFVNSKCEDTASCFVTSYPPTSAFHTHRTGQSDV